jgi:ribosome-binding factor A
MSGRRVERVGEAMREVIAELLMREIKDPRIGMVTLTTVEVSPDLRHARAYFSCLGDAATRQRTQAGLQSAAGFMKGQLAKRLRLRYAPEITFVQDPSIEHADRIATLLKEVVPDEE